MPEKSKAWREFLVRFAKKIGKPDAEEYVDSGKWKARQGGNGLATAGDVKIKFTNCTAEDHAKIYRLVRPYDDELIGMFVPFGRVAPELGQKLSFWMCERMSPSFRFNPLRMMDMSMR